MNLVSLEPQLKEVLREIPGINPCGDFIRYSPLYDSLQEERRLDEGEELPEGVWQADIKKTDWSKVVTLCLSILTEKSKDLQVAVWLVEALLLTNGLDGLERGIQLLNELSLKFWKDLYPLPEDGDWEVRLAPYDSLDYQIPKSLFLLTVTSPSSKDFLRYNLADWIDASHGEMMHRKKKENQNSEKFKGRVLFSDVVGSLRKTPLSFYTHLEEKAQGILKISDTLNQTIGEKIGSHVSLFFRLKEQINVILKHLATWKPQALKQEESKVIPKNLTTIDASEDILFIENSSNGTPEKHLASRSNAYDTLGKITDFLLEQDPHSPTPYLLKRAMGWKDKNLPEVYSEWSQSPEELMFLMRFLGVKK
ncbi:MAG: type VI secretion system protein TssA [Holosporales bacterium]|nr:type VI secretion system protein TssA [Holosporales bacterium]